MGIDNEMLKQVIEILIGHRLIDDTITIPAAADPANDVSVYGALRKVFDENTTLYNDWINDGRLDNLLDDIPTNAEAEALIENAVDSGDQTHEITEAADKTEVQVFEAAKAGIYALSAFFDLDVLETAGEGGTVTLRLYNKIDGTNYSDIPTARVDYVVGTSSEYPSFEADMLHGYSKITIQCSTDLTAARTIAYRYIVRDLGT